MPNLYTAILDTSTEILDFLKNRSKVRYAIEIKHTQGTSPIWFFSDDLQEILRVIAGYNWEGGVKNGECAPDNSEYSLNKCAKEFGRWIVTHREIYGENVEEFQQHLASVLFDDSNSYPTLYDLKSGNNFKEMLKYMRENENFDWDAYQKSQEEEGEEFYKEEVFRKELENCAKYIAREMCEDCTFDSSFLEKILNDNKDDCVRFKMYDKKMKYISTRGREAAFFAVFQVGNTLRLSNYRILKSEKIYADIISYYKYFSELVSAKAVDHLLRVLVSIKNKINDMEHKGRLEEYVEEQRYLLEEMMKKVDTLIPSHVNMTSEMLCGIEIPSNDQRKAECPTCLKALGSIPDARTKCPHCDEVMFVKTRPNNERVVVTREEANKISEEWVIHCKHVAPFF